MTHHHPLEELFMQLGLPHTAKDIKAFVANHRLPDHASLADADFWTATQAQFLHEAIADDADWAVAVDQLNTLLRQ